MSEPEQKKSEVRYISVAGDRHGQRIDNLLLSELKGVPKSYVYRILRRGEVRVNKGRKSASYKVQAGDSIRIPPLRLSDSKPPRFDQRLLNRLEQSILHEDKRLLVLDKPSGVAVHGGSGLKFGAIEAVRHLRPKEQHLELVHRLDRDTSGCLLISKRRSVLRALQELLRSHEMEKRYLALVAGSWEEDQITVDAPLMKNTLRSGERMVRVDRLGKSARTRFRVRQRYSRCMLVEAELVTGRTHQIRVHARHLGTPIIGDEKYGDDGENRVFRKLGLRRLFLHAESIGFYWPGDSDKTRFSAPLESPLEALLERLSQASG